MYRLFRARQERNAKKFNARGEVTHGKKTPANGVNDQKKQKMLER
jgi:hypothetical protein